MGTLRWAFPSPSVWLGPICHDSWDALFAVVRPSSSSRVTSKATRNESSKAYRQHLEGVVIQGRDGTFEPISALTHVSSRASLHTLRVYWIQPSKARSGIRS